MAPILQWNNKGFEFEFTCKSDQTLIPVEDWALQDTFLSNGNRASLGPLFTLVEDEVAAIKDDTTIILTQDNVANLSRNELSQIGLPDHHPYNLHIEGKGLLTDRDFNFLYRFLHTDMRPAMGVERNGVLLKVGNARYVIPNPFFSILEDIDSYNQTPLENIESRFLIWGRIKQNLPEDTVVGDYLKSILIAKADAFTLNPYLNEKGEPDFDPILLRHYNIHYEDGGAESAPEYSNCLPMASQKHFLKQFISRSDVHTRYALGGGWYLVIPEELKRVLIHVRKAKTGSIQERRALLSNPHQFFKEKLADEIKNEVLENLFFEDVEYSERVKEIGVWQPVVLPFIRMAKEPWLPPEEIGIKIGNKFCIIEPKDVENILDKVQRAFQQGRPFVTYKDEKIPANTNTIDALKRLISETKPEKKTEPEKKNDELDKESNKIALIIYQNLESENFKKRDEIYNGQIGTIPRVVNSKLITHQLEGLKWLQEHWISGSRGALLADDMGLGKTLQALTFMAWINEQMELGRHKKLPMLIVAPTGLLKNWNDEHNIHLYMPGLGDLVNAYGSDLKKLRKVEAGKSKELEGGLPVLDISELNQADWVLTTYETLRDYQHSFGRIHWSIIVFDEAQKIKNPSALMTDAAKAMNSDFTLMVTGTPVENRLSDLWSIIDAAQPGRLGALKDFVSSYERNNNESTDQLKKLKTLLSENQPPALMMRRMKEGNLDGLTDKIELPKNMIMPEVQAKAYENEISHARNINEPKQGQMLEVIQHLRSISLHPFKREDESDDEYINSSARLIVTFEILDEIASREQKALIFTESRQIQGLLAEMIQRRYQRERPLIINGAVSGPRRKERVDAFQNRKNFDVMILSPRAGGVGLTLTAANHVIHLSRWWNPAVEDQCTDRAYRIGQKKDVSVYYPIAIHPVFKENSFDLKLNNLLDRKRLLSHTLLAPPAATHKDAENLFKETIDAKESGTDSDQLNKIDLMEPVEFENWVLEQLKNKGYFVKKTPKSWDRGADGIAIAPENSGMKNMIIQCKHTQLNRKIERDAVDEILRAVRYYSKGDQELHPIIVTNSERFSEKAVQLARKHNVELIDRNRLRSL